MNKTWTFIIFALITGAGAHFLAASRAPGKDCGGFWAQALDRLCIWLGIPLLVLACIHNIDLVKPYLPQSDDGWLKAAAVGWLAILALGIVRPPLPGEGRWIAGTLEFSPRRFWLFGFFVPFLPALLFTAAPWTDEIYAAHWALVVAFLIAITGMALSASPVAVWEGIGRKPLAEQPMPLSPWPDEMNSRGIALQPIATWELSVLPEPATGAAAVWQRRLARAGSDQVSGVLCDAVSRLIWTPQKSERLAVVLGPDSCGQEEVTALVATELSRRHGETTLIITSAPDAALARRLSRHLEELGGENPIQLADLSGDPGARAAGDLLLVDAETLSESVLDHLRGALQQEDAASAAVQNIARIGLVVWWNSHEFSGVLAAHVWAVSRRLERLLKSRRGPAARAIVFARPPEDREGLFLGFLEHLLPYPLKKGNTFQIPPDYARKTNLYRLRNESPIAVWSATKASLLTDWPTLPPPDYVLPAELPHRPAEAPPDAGARIFDVRPSEILSVRQMICRGGRSGAANREHHVAIAHSDNPYVNFLAERYGDQSQRGASVNLVSAAGHSELIRRHLLVALREVPDTLTGLRATFRWEEAMLRNTLQRLSVENRLNRVPVRFLDGNGRLQRDSKYTNQNPGQETVRSFRTVGLSRPVELRDPNVRDRLLMQVDPERLPIDAYPRKVIESQGRRYRLQGWSKQPGRIDCLPEERQIQTWRFALSRVTPLGEARDPLTFIGALRYTARVEYGEDVNGVLERHPDGAFHVIGINRVRTSFQTEAVIIEFTERFTEEQLVSAVVALRHVLPVHLAVEEDAMAVVPVMEGSRQGLALVDLYPGGIGVVSAIHKTVWLVPMLFDQVGLWLGTMARGGSSSLANSPFVRTMDICLNVHEALKVFNSTAWQVK